jgi:hypothetical protein
MVPPSTTSRTTSLMSKQLSAVIHRLQTDAMTPKERNLTKFTRRNLQQLSNWAAWDAAFNAQLDAHHAEGAFGTPVP